MIGNKKTQDIQFYREVVEQSHALGLLFITCCETNSCVLTSYPFRLLLLFILNL